jgi:hypothetical protein
VIRLLGSEIGRGHAFYLDGVERALRALSPGVPVSRTDVFAVSRGLSLAAWNAVRSAYLLGARGGLVGAAYARLRRHGDYDRPSLVLDVLGRDLRRWAGADGIVVVDHPAVAGALRGRRDVWYVHGEMCAPPEAIVRCAERILIPLEETAEEFVRGGVERTRLVVTGICVENELVAGAEAASAARHTRLSGHGPLRIAFFSSGAEPSAHVDVLAVGACALAHGGMHEAVVFARRAGRLEGAVRRESSRTGAEPRMVPFVGREELDRVTARELDAVDVVVSPPHERVNWAVALGIPFLLVGPDLGPFAPRNRAILERRRVAMRISSSMEAVALPARLDRLRRDGVLAAMSARGTGLPYRGFENAAAALVAESARRSRRG